MLVRKDWVQSCYNGEKTTVGTQLNFKADP